MKSRVVRVVLCGLVFALCAGTATSGYAADKAKEAKADFALPSMQLGDYSVKLDTDEPQKTSALAPSGLSTLRKESPRAFLGLSLSRPLPDHFWNFMR